MRSMAWQRTTLLQGWVVLASAQALRPPSHWQLHLQGHPVPQEHMQQQQPLG
jgi:hypothetical protein